MAAKFRPCACSSPAPYVGPDKVTVPGLCGRCGRPLPDTLTERPAPCAVEHGACDFCGDVCLVALFEARAVRICQGCAQWAYDLISVAETRRANPAGGTPAPEIGGDS